jgi:hypothetical protein
MLLRSEVPETVREVTTVGGYGSEARALLSEGTETILEILKTRWYCSMPSTSGSNIAFGPR